MPHIIPFGDRLLVTKKSIGEKLGREGLIVAPDSVKERDTDLATVVHVPDNSFADEELIKSAEDIIKSLTEKSKAGDPEALKALLQFRAYLNIKTLKPGDDIMIGKYVGTTFEEKETGKNYTLCTGDDVIGRVYYD